MKYYLIKEENYNPEAEKGKKFFYTPITEVDDLTRSKEIMIYDEINNKCWYSFLFHTEPKLLRLKKSQLTEILENIKQSNQYKEDFGEVSKEIFLEVLENMSAKEQIINVIYKKIKKNIIGC